MRTAIRRDMAEAIRGTATAMAPATVMERGKDENDTHRHRPRDAVRLQARAERQQQRVLPTVATETDRSDCEHLARAARPARRADQEGAIARARTTGSAWTRRSELRESDPQAHAGSGR